jgi:acyl-CoA synthetase (AMP-forming)/AMP-acid ligase II
VTGRRFGDLPAEAAARWGDREALVFRDRRFTFHELADAVDRAARGFIRLGIRPGETVALWLVNCPEWIVAMLALGSIAV